MRGGDIDRGEKVTYLLPWIIFHFVPARAVKGVQPPSCPCYPEIVYIANEALNGKDESNALHDIDLNMIEKSPIDSAPT